jgi:hypothetical protein
LLWNRLIVVLTLLASATGFAGEAVTLSSKGAQSVGVQTAEARSLVGYWSGKILGRKIGSMAHVRIELAAIGMPSGSTEYFLRSLRGYDNLACRGYLKLVEVTGSRYVFEESLTERGRGYEGGCPIAGTLVLTVSGDGVARGEWSSVGGAETVIQSGDLAKQ